MSTSSIDRFIGFAREDGTYFAKHLFRIATNSGGDYDPGSLSYFKEHRIMKNLFFLCLLILGIFLEEPSFAATRKCTQRSYRVSLSGDIASFEAYCHGAINKVREEHGLPPLNWWSQLSDCAREHSQNMANGKCPFGHDGFKNRANKMQKIAKLSSFGENVAYSHNYDDPVKIAVESWMKSNGHQKNILGDFEETGIGVAITKEGKFYITQLFAKRY